MRNRQDDQIGGLQRVETGQRHAVFIECFHRIRKRVVKLCPSTARQRR